MGKFYPKLNEFRIFTNNFYTNPHLFNDENHIAKVIFNRKKK